MGRNFTLYPAKKIVHKKNPFTLNKSNTCSKEYKVQTMSSESVIHFDQQMNHDTIYNWKLFQTIFNLLIDVMVRPFMFCLDENWKTWKVLTGCQ